MNRKTISIIVLVTVVALLIGGGLLLYQNLHHSGVTGSIEFGYEYQLSEIRPGAFEGLTLNKDSYFKINPDQKTGELNLVGVAKFDFIVTNYQEGATQTTIDIEFIYKNELYQLQAQSTASRIVFKMPQRYRTDITQEHPDDTKYLEYESTVLVFTKQEVAWCDAVLNGR